MPRRGVVSLYEESRKRTDCAELDAASEEDAAG